MTGPNQVEKINQMVRDLLAVDKVADKPLYKLRKNALIAELFDYFNAEARRINSARFRAKTNVSGLYFKYSTELVFAVEDCLPYYDPQKGDFLFYCKKALERRKKEAMAEEFGGGTKVPQKKAQIFGKLRRWLDHRGIHGFPTGEQLDMMAECLGQPREKLERFLVEMERSCIISVPTTERDRDDGDDLYEMTDSERRFFSHTVADREETEGELKGFGGESEDAPQGFDGDEFANGQAEAEIGNDSHDGEPGVLGVEVKFDMADKERLRGFFVLFDECVRECQERQQPILAALITAKLCSAAVLDEAELAQYIFFDAEVYREFLRTGLPLTQRDIADRFGRNEASISRTWSNFLDENQHLRKLLR